MKSEAQIHKDKLSQGAVVQDDQTRLERFLAQIKGLAARASNLLTLALFLNALAALFGFLLLLRVWNWSLGLAVVALLLSLLPALLLVLYQQVFSAILGLPIELGEAATELLQVFRKDALEPPKKVKLSLLSQMSLGFKHYRSFAKLVANAKQLYRSKNLVTGLAQIRYAGILMNPLFWLGLVVLLAISFVLSPTVIVFCLVWLL